VYSESLLTLHVEEDPDSGRPLILSPGHMAGQVGETIIYQITSNQLGSGGYAANGLPPGFDIDASSGLIYGSLDHSYRGSFRVYHGSAATDVLLEVYPEVSPLLLVESPPSALGEPGQWFEFQIETNATEIGASNLDFYPVGNWPDSLSLDRETGLIYGYLGEDWSPQLAFEIHWGGRLLGSSLTVIDAAAARPASVVSPAHVTAFEGDYVEYAFELDRAGAEIEILGNDSGLFFDATQRKFHGYLADGPNVVDFEIDSVPGILTFQSLDPYLRPSPLIVSKLLPVVEAGQTFEYKLELDQPDATLRLEQASEDWIQQTGPLTLSGIVPKSGLSDRVWADILVETDHQSEWFEIGLSVSKSARPLEVVSPATAAAEVGVPFSYQLKVDPLRDGDQVDVVASDWLNFDQSSMRLTGVPDQEDVNQVDVTVHTASGTFDATIQIVTSLPSPPIVEMQVPPPGFLNVPYQLPFVVDEPFYVTQHDLSGGFSPNLLSSAIEGVPDSSAGQMHFQFGVGNSADSSEVNGVIRFVESAPVFIEQLQSMTTFEGGKALFSPRLGGQADFGEWYKDEDQLVLTGAEFLEIQFATLADQGTYTLHLENSIGTAVSQPTWLTVGTPRKIRDWTIAHVGELYESQPGGDPEASWLGDGVSNLMKWSMGLPLLEPHSGPLVGGAMTSDALQLQFSRNTEAGDMSIVVERSANLAADSWQSIARRPASGVWQILQDGVTIEESGSGAKRDVTIRDTMVGDQSFLRVRFELDGAEL